MKDVSIETLSAVTIHAKYAKYIPELNRRETWKEICERNMLMHIRRYPQLSTEIQRVYHDFVIPKKVLPSMRSMQFGGRPIELAPSRIFNCAFGPADHTDLFSEAMFLLLGGTGLGFSVQKRHVKHLPSLKGPRNDTRRFVVGDSIEGWADAIKVLTEAYFHRKARPIFDFSDIRPKGALLVTSGGKAPGPEPLARCIDALSRLFDRILAERGPYTYIKPIEALDTLCHIADAVLAGGIRRAALICLFDLDDEDMLRAKSNMPCELRGVTADADGNITGTIYNKLYDREYPDCWVAREDMEGYFENGTLPWFVFEPQRGRANNSAVLVRGRVTREQFDKLWADIEASGAGEPGVYWTNNPDYGTNPCAEIALRPNQFCNLTEVNVDDVVDQEDLNARARAGAFIGTLQAGYTDFHYLRPIWRETTEKEALIGVGLTGIASGAVLGLDLKEAASIVKRENALVAARIGIECAARTTTVKPAGTSSLVLGSSSGIHAWHNEHYIRRVRVGKNEAIYRYLEQNHPRLVKDEHFRPRDQAVIEVPQKAPAGALMRHEPVEQLLNRVGRFNREWVQGGHRSGANAHNVSCTISVKDDEWATVGEWMWDNRGDYNGISVLPYDGGTYIQAPFEDIDEAEYHERVNGLSDIDLSQVIEIEDNTDLTGEVACGAGGCELR